MTGVTALSDDSTQFQGPSIDEFFPDPFLFAGTPFAINRIMMVRLIATAVLLFVVWLGVRSLKVVPGRGQGVLEFAFSFVQKTIVEDTLGKKQGERFLPLLTSIFFMVFALNVTAVIPGLNVASTALIGVPIILAVVAWVTFVYVGIKQHGGWKFLKYSLFPKGVPWPLYILITPIEFASTFIFRPVTLALRLTMNMFVGHILIVLLFTATSFFLFNADGIMKAWGIGTLAFGFIFTLFEMLIIGLQAFIFTLLTANYIRISLEDGH